MPSTSTLRVCFLSALLLAGGARAEQSSPQGLRWSGGAGLPEAGRPSAVWGVVLAWGDLHPTPERLDWSSADRTLSAIDRAGREAVPILAPRHPASPRTDLASEYAKALRDPSRPRARDWLPPDLDAWLAFVRAVVGRYGPAADPALLQRPVRSWQLTEEFPGGWAGSDEELSRFFRATAQSIHEADPAARVILPALCSDDLALFAFADGAIAGGECIVGRGRFVRRAIEKNLRVQAERDRYIRVLEALQGTYDAVDVHLVVRLEYIEPCLGWVRSALDGAKSRAAIVSSRGGGPVVEAGETMDPTALRRRAVLHAATALACGASEIAWDWDPPHAATGEGAGRIALSDSSEAAADWERMASKLEGPGEWTVVRGGAGVRFRHGDAWIGIAWAEGPGEIAWSGEGRIRLVESDGTDRGQLESRDGAWTFSVDRLPVFLLPP